MGPPAGLCRAPGIRCLEIQLCRTWKSSVTQNMLTLHGIVPSAVQTWVLIATQEVHIYLFTFSVYCLHSSGRQRYYFSVEDPRKAATLRSVFDPSTHCSTTDIMRDCREKLPVPVEALGAAPKQRLPLSPLRMPFWDACVSRWPYWPSAG